MQSDTQGEFKMKKVRVWISFDLGVKGDYEGMYSWLDAREAKECGDSVATFLYELHSDNIEIEDILNDIKNDIEKNVDLDPKKNRVYVIAHVKDNIKGIFIFGRRRNAPWVGSADTGEQGDDNG
jgi:uncharacterized protein (UPF0128 family)